MDSVVTSTYHSAHPWLNLILGAAAILAVVSGGLEAFIRGYRKSLPKEKATLPPPPPDSEDWDVLCSRANRVIEEIIAQLPSDIAIEAREVPYLFKERSEKESKGYRMLGSYHNFIPGHKSDYKGPIFLYLKSIEEVCAENKSDFDAEVRTTYLHELGHHFGWDEVDLVRHGLPSGRPPGG